MEHVGELVRYHRGRLRLTQEELAEKARVSPATLVRLEGGEIRQPRIGTIAKLAGALGVDPGELTGFVTQKQPTRPPEPVGASKAGRVLTAIYELTEDGWWVVSVPEIPGAHSQGRTLDEAREMIGDAVRMLLEVRREDAQRETMGKENVVREPLEV